VKRPGLTARQQQILDYLVKEVQEKGYAPSVREIAEALGLRSPSTVHQHLTAIESKGYIHRHGERMRALEVVDKTLLRGGTAIALPLVGRVSAGLPSLAAEEIEEHIEIPRALLGDVRDCFLLRIKGDSMIGAGIMPGDIVIVRRQPAAAAGEIVVALLDEDATVKTFGMSNGKPVLLPANPVYQPIRAPFQIIGRVIGLFRAYEGVYGWS
jgi:repressor LexA